MITSARTADRSARRLLRVVLAGFALALLAAPGQAQRGDDTHRRSKNGRLQAEIGGASVTVEYGRPHVLGRTVWGGLVPWDRVWRAGADEATTVEVDRDVSVEGARLAAGRYALFVVPRDGAAWTVVFNRDADQWGAFGYDRSKDALRVDATPRPHDHVEILEFASAGDELLLRWEKLELALRVEAAN